MENLIECKNTKVSTKTYLKGKNMLDVVISYVLVLILGILFFQALPKIHE